jgi:hypothetical protein
MTWVSIPSTALWYGEIIIGRPGETDYLYGYSSDDFPPDPADLLGDNEGGWEILESKIERCPR